MAVSSYPETEREHVRHIEGQLFGITRFVRDFEAAVSLFNFSSMFPHEITGNWQFVAARDGAMSIYHFAKTIEGVRAAFGDCPTYRSAVDHRKLRAATKDIEVSFPGFEKLRHALAHNAELRRSHEHAAQNATKGPFDNFGIKIEGEGSVTIGNGLNGNKFFTSIDGIMASYEISRDSLASLQRIHATFESGFIPAGYMPMRWS